MKHPLCTVPKCDKVGRFKIGYLYPGNTEKTFGLVCARHDSYLGRQNLVKAVQGENPGMSEKEANFDAVEIERQLKAGD